MNLVNNLRNSRLDDDGEEDYVNDDLYENLALPADPALFVGEVNEA